MSKSTLKIAIVTDDGQTISRHFGRARYYAIYTVQDGQVVSTEQVEKEMHHHGHHSHGHASSNVQLHETHESHGDHDHEHEHDASHNHDHDHAEMFAPLAGCDVVLARGMGQGAYNGLNAIGVQPIVTDIPAITDAVRAYVDGTITNHPEKLH
jgi:predicted Fe-Mo cluster-binding NifX family protein